MGRLPNRIQVACLSVGSDDPTYVAKLYSMLSRQMPVPFELTCALDRPLELSSAIRTVDVRDWPAPRQGMRPTTYKLGLYDREKFPLEEFFYFDTSLIIRKNLSPLLEFAYSSLADLVTVQDWNYDAYNTSVMRIRQTEQLAEIPKAYAAGEVYPQRVPGDQDFVTAVLRDRGRADEVETFPEGLVQSYGVARKASRKNWAGGRRLLDQAVILKFNGPVKMDHLLDPRFRLRQILHTKNPFHRRAWFGVSDVKAHWR